MNIIYTLLYIYLLLRPYYFFKSGGLQISDIFLILAFILLLFISKNDKLKLVKPLKDNKEFLIFTIFTFIVNGIYFIIYLKFKFILSSLYFAFNLMAIILFSTCFQNKDFLIKTKNIFKINLLMQLIIYILNIGKYYDASRYMGTFNDPNQFGYYILLSIAYIYLIGNFTNNKKNELLYFVISIFLIYLSASTGMILGIVVFLIQWIISNIKNINSFMINNKNKIVILSIFILFLIMIFKTVGNFKFIDNIMDSSVVQRIENKLSRVEVQKSNNSMSLWEERGYDKLMIYPQYLIYGSGEGEYNRFYKSAHTNEIHATLPSIWFYYGIIPLIIIVIWLYKKINKLNIYYKIVCYALLLESFTLLNQRQVLFWTIFILANSINNKEETK